MDHKFHFKRINGWVIQLYVISILASTGYYSGPNLFWCRDRIGPKLVAWNNLLPRIANITLGHEPHVFCWNLTPNGQFLIEITLSCLIHLEVSNLNKLLWKIKAPLKIKIFLWHLCREVVLTKKII